MPGHDAAQTGRTDVHGPAQAKFVLASTAVSVDDATKIAVASDGTVYVNTKAGLTALTDQLAWKWEVPTSPRQAQAPAIGADGTVYFTAGQSTGEAGLYAVSPAGQPLWNLDATLAHPTLTSDPGVSSPTIACDGTLFFTKVGQVGNTGPGFSRLFAVSAAGIQRWAQDYQTATVLPLIAPAGTVYLPGPIAINPDRSLWWANWPALCDWIVGIGDDGMIYGGGRACAADGTPEWQAPSADNTWQWAVSKNGTAYGAGMPGGIALRKDGSVAWTSALPVGHLLGTFFSPVALDDGAGILYFVVSDNGGSYTNDAPPHPAQSTLYALDSTTGTRRWAFDLGGFCYPSAIALGLSQRLYVSCGKLYLFESR